MSGALAPRARALRDAARRWRPARGDTWPDLLFVPVAVLLLGAYFSWVNPYFLTEFNLTNLFVQGAILALVAFGVTFVILSGEFDLSVGSGVALASVVAAFVMRDTGSLALGLAVAILVGCLIGVFNGLVVTQLEVPSFIATFGTLTIAAGIALAATDGGVVTGLPDGISVLPLDKFLGIPWIVWLVIVSFAVLYHLSKRTAFGIRVLAVGGNREAARLAGIPVNRVRFLCFLLSGMMIGLAAIALTSRLQSGEPNAGQDLALDAVAAVVIGGTSIFGGRGSLARTAWGVLLIATMRNGLDLEGVTDDLKRVLIGLVLIAAASTDFVRRKLRRRRVAAAVAERL